MGSTGIPQPLITPLTGAQHGTIRVSPNWEDTPVGVNLLSTVEGDMWFTWELTLKMPPGTACVLVNYQCILHVILSHSCMNYITGYTFFWQNSPVPFQQCLAGHLHKSSVCWIYSLQCQREPVLHYKPDVWKQCFRWEPFLNYTFLKTARNAPTEGRFTHYQCFPSSFLRKHKCINKSNHERINANFLNHLGKMQHYSNINHNGVSYVCLCCGHLLMKKTWHWNLILRIYTTGTRKIVFPNHFSKSIQY